MKMSMYAVYDCKAQIHGPVMAFVNDPVAIRTMENCVRNNEHPYGQNPEDFTLYQVGEYDDVTGNIESQRRQVIDLITLAKLEESNHAG